MEAATRSTSVSQALAWLQSDEVVMEDGAVLSWSNPNHDGYAYPEIAGYLLNLLAQQPDSSPEIRRRIASRIARDVSPEGGVGRRGIRYVFDTGMVLTGLMAERKVAGELPDPDLPQRLFEFIATEIKARRAATAPTMGSGAHWSTTYGCHLLKMAQSISAYGDAFGDERAPALVNQLVADLTPLAEDGRFRIHDHEDYSYLHSHCYALEGLAVIEAASPRGWLWPIIRRGALWLGRIQDESGGVRAHNNGFAAWGELRGDATAQAVRIWSLVDRNAFAGEISAATAFLQGLQTECGGYRYSPNSRDVNTWVTLFTTQALMWASEGGNARCVV